MSASRAIPFDPDPGSYTEKLFAAALCRLENAYEGVTWKRQVVCCGLRRKSDFVLYKDDVELHIHLDSYRYHASTEQLHSNTLRRNRDYLKHGLKFIEWPGIECDTEEGAMDCAEDSLKFLLALSKQSGWLSDLDGDFRP